MPSISRDGQLIMFLSKATNIDPSPDPIACAPIGTTASCQRIFLAGRTAGSVTRVPLGDFPLQFKLDSYRVEVLAAVLSGDGRTIALDTRTISKPGIAITIATACSTA